MQFHYPFLLKNTEYSHQIIQKNMVRHRKPLFKMKDKKKKKKKKNWWPPFQLIKKVMTPLSAHQKSHDPPPYSTPPPVEITNGP